MFAVIFLISIISLLLMGGVQMIHKKMTPWDLSPETEAKYNK